MSDESVKEHAVDLDVDEDKVVDAQRLGVSLKVSKMSKNFEEIKALQDISFSLTAGETLGIMGNNGAGKSTLCDVVCGLTRQNSGKIFIDGQDVSTWSPNKRAKTGIRRVFANPVIFEELSVEENILIGSPPSQGEGLLSSLFVPNMVTKAQIHVVRQIMEYCLVDSAIKSAKNHSFGSKKRIELARSLMGNPRILILDEPSASLTDDEKEKYCQVVADYSQTFSTTLIVVDSDIDCLRQLCKRAVVLDAGKLIANSELTDVLHDVNVKKTYLGEK